MVARFALPSFRSHTYCGKEYLQQHTLGIEEAKLLYAVWEKVVTLSQSAITSTLYIDRKKRESLHTMQSISSGCSDHS